MISPKTSLLLTIIATSLGFVVVQVDVTIVNIALVQIGNRLSASISSLQWIVDTYALVFASLLMSSGSLGDQFGTKRMFLWGLGVFSVASLTCGLSQTATQLIISRALQGIGAALIIPNSLALLNHACVDNFAARARALALWSAAGGLATAIGPIIGGILVYSIGWRSIFLVNIPIGIFGVWFAYRYVNNTNTFPCYRRIDLPGQLLVIITLFTVTASVITAGTVGWTNWRIINGIILAVIIGYTFIRVEANSQHPMLPLDFFRNTQFSAAVVAGFLNNLAFYGLIFILGLFFQNILHYSALQAGLAFIPLAGATISNLIVGRIVAERGTRLPIIIGFLIAAIGYGSLQGINENTHYLEMLLPLILIPFGLGLAIPSITTALLSTIDQSRSGIASAVFTTMRQTGGAIGVAIFGALISEHVATSIPGFQIVFITCACLSLIAAAISAIWIGKHTKNKTNLPS